MQKRLFNLVELLIEGIEENAKEISLSSEAERIDLQKNYEVFKNQITEAKKEIKLERNSKIMETYYKELENTNGIIETEQDYKAASGFRKKEEITEKDIEEAKSEEKKLNILKRIKESGK